MTSSCYAGENNRKFACTSSFFNLFVLIPLKGRITHYASERFVKSSLRACNVWFDLSLRTEILKIYCVMSASWRQTHCEASVVSPRQLQGLSIVLRGVHRFLIASHPSHFYSCPSPVARGDVRRRRRYGHLRLLSTFCLEASAFFQKI